MSRLLIVIISSREPTPVEDLPKAEGERIASVAPNTFWVFSSRNSFAYAEDLKQKIKAPHYVIKPDSYGWNGKPQSAEAAKFLNDARSDGDGPPPIFQILHD